MIFGFVQRIISPLASLYSPQTATRTVQEPLLSSLLGSLLPTRGFKVRTSVRLRCDSCYFARRGGTLFVRCKAHPRHKQRQGRATRKQQIF